METQLFARLTGDAVIGPAIGLRVYPDVAPAGTPLPYIRYQVISSPGGSHAMSRDTPIQRDRVQVDVFAATAEQADALAKRLRKVTLRRWSAAATETAPAIEDTYYRGRNGAAEAARAPAEGALVRRSQDFEIVYREG